MKICPRRGAAAVVLASQLAGCSLLFVDRAPPNVPQGAWVPCTESKVFPVIDTVYGVSALIGSVGIGATADDTDNEELGEVGAVIYGLTGAAILYSAYVGWRETSRCAQIHEDAAARGIYGPQPYYPQPYPYPYPPPPQPYPPQPYPPQPQPAPIPAPAPAPQPPR